MFTREDEEKMEEARKTGELAADNWKERYEGYREWRALPRRTGWQPPICMNTDKEENKRMRERIALYSDPLLRNRERPKDDE